MRRAVLPALIAALSCLVALVAPPPTAGHVGLLGDPFEIEGTSVCQLDNGDLAVTWLEATAGQSDWLRIYAPDGVPRGAAILVFQDPDDSPLVQPALCCRPAGGLRIVWGVPSDLFATNALESRSFDNAGLPTGPVVPVTGESPLNVPQTVACYDTGFLVHWYRETGDGGDPAHHLVRRFGADGLPVGGEFRVDASPSSFEPASDLAARPDGSFVVAWTGPGEGNLTAQGYDASDQEVGPELAVRALGGSEIFADVDVAINEAGTRMFVWTEDEFFFDFPHVLGRAFDAAGVPVTDAFSVDGDPTLQYSSNEVAADSDGNFVVAWGRVSDGRLAAQTFTADGQRLGSEVVAAPDGQFAGNRFEMTLTPPRAGKLAFAHFGEDAGGQTVPFNRYLVEGLIFSDGFESGDTSAWSASTP